jgi:UDP-N-acetylmuramoyl-L-alanyl-D-glutamate--2,6-diaminopimelate ligase
MTLGALVRAAPSLQGVANLAASAFDREVTGLAYDSRRVTAGALFVAVRGQHVDATAFAADAVRRGAVAVVAETPPPAEVHAPWLVTADARLALAELAAAFYDHPSRALSVVGITGTNGKTTTAYLASAILERAGVRCGRIGTIGYVWPGAERDAHHTTPEAPDLQALLRQMVDGGCRACVMEVSSHALALRRVDAIRFRAAVFTNLTRDHLDFHGSFEAYFEAKRRLFDLLPEDGWAVVNLDDPYGQRILDAGLRRPVTYAVDRPADVTPGPFALSFDGLRFDVRTPRGRVPVSSRLVGRPNVYNILAAAAVAVAWDLPAEAIARGVADVEQVPGRFQVVSAPDDPVTVVVDYAHTDDALKNLLETARPLAAGRLITVFGCGGDRDRTKRPLMGAVAARLSDVVVVTSDNPRTEDPEAIIADILRGVPSASGRASARPAGGRAPVCLAIPDRREAIARAIREAQPGDVVLIAGKGHERYQILGDRAIPFDDADVARAVLGERRRAAAREEGRWT